MDNFTATIMMCSHENSLFNVQIAHTSSQSCKSRFHFVSENVSVFVSACFLASFLILASHWLFITLKPYLDLILQHSSASQ